MRKAEHVIHHTREREAAALIARSLRYWAVEVYRRGEHIIVQAITSKDERR